MKNIIFLINIKNPTKPNRTQGYDLSIESWKRWANKNDCEVFVLTEPVVDLSEMSPIIMRHYVFELLENSGIEYDQICMVDAANEGYRIEKVTVTVDIVPQTPN
jgi:hypothetical protein